jgi:sporulation protein YlmC with PRC-barrel domain
MKGIVAMLLAAVFFAFGLPPNVSAAGMEGSKDMSAWIGKDVINSEGEVLGDIENFVLDENGEIVIAVVSFDERSVPVPYDSLSFDESEDHVILDATMDQLANAPEIESDENLADRAALEEVYRHFGERPYWDDEGAAELDSYGYFGTEEGMTEEFDADRDTDTQAGAGLDYGY